QAILAGALRRLEGLYAEDRIRWHDLLWFILSWALRRRSGQERALLLETAASSQAEIARQKEIQAMSNAIGQTWEEELLARGEARGRTQGELLAIREALRSLLEDRFNLLPEVVVRQIEAAEDPAKLKAALRQVSKLNSLDELKL